MKYVISLITAVLFLCFVTELFSREEMELAIGYIPETQHVTEPVASPEERQAVAVLIKAAQARTDKPEEQPQPIPVFQDPVIV